MSFFSHEEVFINHTIERNLLTRSPHCIACVELNFPTQLSHTSKGNYHLSTREAIIDLMASKLLFHLKERKKPKDGTDELAVVKAAAWAWYQHGSGTEGKAVCEFDATRTHHATRPSRYMLEAMKMDREAKEGPQSIHTKKSLLDAYEIESISRQLDNLMESKHNKLIVNGNYNPADAGLDNGSRRMKKKKKIRKWFWLRHGAICGTGDDVINSSASALRDGRRQ